MSLSKHLYNRFALDEDQLVEIVDGISDNMMVDRDLVLDRVNKLYQTEFPRGYMNVPNEFYLYRLLYRTPPEKLNKEDLGQHWTPDPTLMTDEVFISLLDTGSVKDASLILIAKIRLYWIRIEQTIKQNIMYPYEYEYNVSHKFNEQFDEIYYCNFRDFDTRNPLQSKNLTQIK